LLARHAGMCVHLLAY